VKEWIYGRHPVREHLETLPGTCERLLIAEGSRPDPELEEAARRAGVPVERVPKAKIDRQAAGANHQGVCLLVSGWGYRDLDEIVARVRRPEGTPLVFALDCVQDPRNLGAVIRVADGVGAAGVIVPKDRAAGLTAAAARSAAGAAATMPVAQVTNLARTLRELKDEGLWIVGASHEAERTVFDLKAPFPAVLVLGAEGSGLRQNVAAQCDALAKLPMLGTVSSLNVSVAAGVFAYELWRKSRSA
jgi:23S rRNA (guanosine2251-2'-O)-methyltransferase